MNMMLPRVLPSVVNRTDCIFYHSIDLPGETITGIWDIRGAFSEYIGNVDLRGKSVLDVGTAGGFLAFEAEKAGAASVLALDARTLMDQVRVPIQGTDYCESKAGWASERAVDLDRQKNAFWFAHHALRSKCPSADFLSHLSRLAADKKIACTR